MKKDERIETLEEKVVVDNTSMQVVENEEPKKEKTAKVVKKVGKVAAVVGICALGYFLGKRSNSKSTNYDEITDVDYEVESDDE